MAERPFMQFYGSDFVGDTMLLSAEQIGAYMLLLIAMWNAHGRLPNDPKKLARAARVTVARWQKLAPDLMPFFEHDEIEIWHKRMQKNLKNLEKKSAQNRESGAKGGRAKALKDKEADLANAKILPQRKATIARATPEPEPELEVLRKEERTPAVQASRFPEFWSVYPHKVGKPDAMKAFDRASKRIDFDTMMEGLARYVGKTDDRPWCNPSTWLNQDRWADQPATVARQQQPRRQSEMNDFLDHYINETERRENEQFAESSRASTPSQQYAIPGPRRHED